MSWFSINTLNVNAVIMVCRSSWSLIVTWPVHIFYTAFATKRMQTDFFSVIFAKSPQLQVTVQHAFWCSHFPSNYSMECNSELYYWLKEKEKLGLSAAVQKLEILLLKAIFEPEALKNQEESSQTLPILFQNTVHLAVTAAVLQVPDWEEIWLVDPAVQKDSRCWRSHHTGEDWKKVGAGEWDPVWERQRSKC